MNVFRFTYIILTFFPILSFGQDIELFQQFNGRYDYIAIGNTLNSEENGPFSSCTILTSSTANLNLSSDEVIQAAYLYWAGSGTGDFDISLNDNAISADRTFSDELDDGRQFFAAFANVTDLIISEGNGDYIFSDLDLTSVIDPFCPTGTNFAGWAITIIFQDNALPLNQINVYDGLQSVPTELTINLTNLNVFDNDGAKIGFIAWEGDNALAVNEQLTINGTVIGNLPLNPPDNAFNGTNSFTEEANLFNMDIDFYSIQDNIAIGDTEATIQLTSGQDFVMINNVITVLNSQLPDATIITENIFFECNSRILNIDYRINNINSTDLLPANTPIAFYANGVLVGQSETQLDIAIGDFETGNISISIPEDIPDSFTLELVVDDIGDSSGIITEINEDNNNSLTSIDLLTIPPIFNLPPLLQCDEGLNTAVFDLTTQFENILANQEEVTFHLTEEDAASNNNAITIPENFSNSSNPQLVFVRIQNDTCFEIAVFSITVENCPPFIPDGFSPNGDDKNDDFTILGLRDIFENFKLLIYNRYGTLIYKGDNSIPNWDGTANQGINNKGKLLPTGTYFYVLHLNDVNFKTLTGWVYLNR